MTYQDALAYFASLEARGWRLGLDRMAAFCAAAGLDDVLGAGPASPHFIHVAGTNGKGTTTAYLQSLLVETGVRTGAFYSPYVVDPRERWQFGRDFIAPEELATLTEELIPVAESFSDTPYGGITEFEFKTAIDFAYAKAKRCEWVALEVGLGGRFDATNMIMPKASAIVSIGMDHVSILGDTLGAIAGEKAGIIKPRIPVVVGDMAPDAAEVIAGVASSCDSPLFAWERDFAWEGPAIGTGQIRTPWSCFEDVTPGIPGAMQGHNLAVAVTAIEAAGFPLTADVVRAGAARASLVGRFQALRALGADFLLDGAHNVQAAKVLAESLSTRYGDRAMVLVTNMVRGHDPQGFFDALAGLAHEAFVVPIDFHRAYPIEEMAVEVERAGLQTHKCSDLDAGLSAAAASGKLVVVTGSFYLVGEALRRLGIR